MPTWIIPVAIGLLLIIWFLYITRSGRDHDSSVFGRFHRAYRRLVFWAGDIRRLHCFPWVTWDVHQHQVEYHEALQILSKCRKGDVGIHRDNGYLSNLAIPGFMKHAWIHVEDPDPVNAMIVEAISDGVVKRHGMFPIRSDFTIILRPKGVSEEDIDRSVKKAESIVGCRYDASFKFDIEDELKLFEKRVTKKVIPQEQAQEDRQELDIAQNNIKAEWDGGFSCTETISFAWWHVRRQLRLFRQQSRGKKVILADQLINNSWEIVAMSDSVTPEIAKKMGLGEEGVDMIKSFRNTSG